VIDGIVDGIEVVVAILIGYGGGYVGGEEVCCLSREFRVELLNQMLGLTLVSLDEHVLPGEDTLFYAGHSLFGGAEGIPSLFIELVTRSSAGSA
jgi:hypothetical protein